MCRRVCHLQLPRRVDAGENASLPLRASMRSWEDCSAPIISAFAQPGTPGGSARRPAHAQGSAVYLVTYVEVMPNATDSGAALLKRYRDASRKEDGNLRFDAMQEIARPNRFAVLEIWKDKAALDAHAKAAATCNSATSSRRSQDAPYDERVNNGLYVALGQEREPGRRDLRAHACRRHSAEQGRLRGGAQGDEHRYAEGLRQHQL